MLEGGRKTKNKGKKMVNGKRMQVEGIWPVYFAAAGGGMMHATAMNGGAIISFCSSAKKFCIMVDLASHIGMVVALVCKGGESSGEI